MKITDPTFGINNQALAVLYYLSGMEANFANEDGKYKATLKTAPWYNGRECGFVVSMSKNLHTWLHIAVFEHRNSDIICAIKCIDAHGCLNPPTTETHGKKFYPTDNKWDMPFTTGPGEVGKMADWIYSQLAEHYAQM